MQRVSAAGRSRVATTTDATDPLSNALPALSG